ncbi:cytochrome P450 [Mucilaginibacter sp. UYCu711]|uniref:cytochrome P450 n=1 Tax=Mucilaginibacter sp. UYCu711 TaxID=3156339 RepID=UPI003D1E6760
MISKALKYIYRLLKQVCHGETDDAGPKEERLLFTFGGRSEGWPGLGRTLYTNEPYFKAAIESCNRIIKKNGGVDILSYFEAPIEANYYRGEENFICITAIQIATVQLYNENGIFPNAVLGLSLGEPSAVFAAGALTVEETIKVILSGMEIHKKADKNYIFLFFKLGMAEGVQLCKKCPVWSEVVYEESSDSLIIVCNQDDIIQFKSFTDAQQIKFKPVTTITNFPYHTSLISLYYHAWENFANIIEPKPLKCDYYSSAIGKCIPKNTLLDNIHWFNIIVKPVLHDTVLRLVLKEGYESVLQIGPPAVSDRQWNQLDPNHRLKIFDTFQLGCVSEISHLNFNLGELKAKIFKPTFLNEKPKAVLTDILKSFDIHAIDLHDQLTYLKKNGEIHFLPLHNSWMVLGYDKTDYILKNPDLFSSSAYNQIDKVLMGADPESHKMVRELLQPLFSSQTIAEVSRKTLNVAETLLDPLFALDQFDLVKDFSDPLSQIIICDFMGFTPSEGLEVRNVLGRDYHNGNFFQRLEQYFNNDFELADHQGDDNFVGKIKKAQENGQLTRADATSLLRLILSAGIATTSTVVGTVLNNLNKTPELTAQIQGNDQLLAKYVEECLRLETPAHYVRRITTQPVEISAQHLPAGAHIYINLRSANRDADHFVNPTVFSIDRPAKRNLVFGSGIHQCIGMGISRAEVRSATQVALTRLEQLNGYTWEAPEYFKDSEVQAMITLKLKRSGN